MDLQYDWSKFEIYFHVERPVEAVFSSWATAKGLESFFIKRALFKDSDGKEKSTEELMATGDSYEWEWWHGFKSQGEILEVKMPFHVSFSFGRGPIVEVDLETFGKGTQIHLLQRNIPSTPEGMVHIHLDCRGGWIYFLTILKGVLEHRVDARDKNPVTAGSLAIRYRPDIRNS